MLIDIGSKQIPIKGTRGLINNNVPERLLVWQERTVLNACSAVQCFSISERDGLTVKNVKVSSH